MIGKGFVYIGIVIFAFAFQYAHAGIKNFSNFGKMVFQVKDTILPITVMTDDKMNIMVDHQKELIALQWKGLNREDREIILTDSSGRIYDRKQMYAGTTIVYFESQTLYEGYYILKVSGQPEWIYQNIKIIKPE